METNEMTLNDVTPCNNSSSFESARCPVIYEMPSCSRVSNEKTRYHGSFDSSPARYQERFEDQPSCSRHSHNCCESARCQRGFDLTYQQAPPCSAHQCPRSFDSSTHQSSLDSAHYQPQPSCNSAHCNENFGSYQHAIHCSHVSPKSFRYHQLSFEAPLPAATVHYQPPRNSVKIGNVVRSEVIPVNDVTWSTVPQRMPFRKLNVHAQPPLTPRPRMNSAIFVSNSGPGIDPKEFFRRYGSVSRLCRKARSVDNISLEEKHFGLPTLSISGPSPPEQDEETEIINEEDSEKQKFLA